MEAGRVLDILVSEKVMGWKVLDVWEDLDGWLGKSVGPDLNYRRAPVSFCMTHNEENNNFIWLYNKDKEFQNERWRPSTSIADAWLVVEEIRRRKKYVYVMSYVDDFFRCEIREYRVKDGGDTIIANEAGDTAPHAICLAALAVVDNS